MCPIPQCHWEAIKPECSEVDKVDNNLAGELCIWEVQHKCVTVFLNGLDVPLEFSNMFAGRSSVDFNHLAGVLDLVKFLVHHNNTDNKAIASI